MTGFQNVEDGVKHFFEHLVEGVDAELKAAIEILMPSIKAVAADIKAKGPGIVLGAVAAAGAAAEASKAAGGDASAMGQAALAAAEKAAVAGASVIGADALHAIATAKVTEALPTDPATTT